MSDDSTRDDLMSNKTIAGGIFFAGWIVLLGLALFALAGPLSKKVMPPVSPQEYFKVPLTDGASSKGSHQPKTQYELLYSSDKSRFDPNDPPKSFQLTDSQKKDLEKWGFDDSVAEDGTAGQGLFGSCFCEHSPAVRAIFEKGFIVQGWNTWSALGFSVVGLVILGFLAFGDPPAQQNRMTRDYFYSLFYSGLTIFLGPASMMFHVGLRNWGGWSDSLSIHIWFGFVLLYNVYRLRDSQSKGWFTLTYIGGALVIGALCVPGALTFLRLPFDIGIGVAALVLQCFVAGSSRVQSTNWSWSLDRWWDPGGRWWFLGAGIVFFWSCFVWIMSFTKNPWCSPEGFQGHAVWHVSAALAGGCLYKYFRHEGET